MTADHHHHQPWKTAEPSTTTTTRKTGRKWDENDDKWRLYEDNWRTEGYPEKINPPGNGSG